VQVHCDEGLANRIGTEPCAGIREGVGEASAGERVGQPLSRESYSVLGADAVLKAEGDTAGRATASVSADPAWSKTLACMDAPCAGTGRAAVHPAGRYAVGSHREGEEP
jgi:hypothetical protein